VGGWECGMVCHAGGRFRDSGKAFDVSIAHIWTIPNRKVVSFESFIDTPEMILGWCREEGRNVSVCTPVLRPDHCMNHLASIVHRNAPKTVA